VELTAEVLRHPLIRPFRAAGRTVDTLETARLCLLAPDGSTAGEGEVASDAWLGQDAGGIAREAHSLADGLLEHAAEINVAYLEAALDGAAPEVSAEARTLVEMTLLDYVARRSGLPVWGVVGLPEPRPVQLLQTVPVGETPPQTGPLKVKLGGPDDLAILRDLTATRSRAGNREPLVIDVNRGWTREDWTSIATLVARVAPTVLEDPVADLDVLAEIRSALPGTTVLLDEGIDDETSMERALEIADGVNIKVTRFGGLLPARRALERLTSAGARRMLGCTIEPPRAIAYAAQLAGLCDWADLDGHLWLEVGPAPATLRMDSSRPGIPRLVSAS
jgi:L-alanine-DL-glutamate epimerase-like enolase superfamily enzyme